MVALHGLSFSAAALVPGKTEHRKIKSRGTILLSVWVLAARARAIYARSGAATQISHWHQHSCQA